MNTLVKIIYLLSKFLTRFLEFQALTWRFNLGYVYWIYRTPSTIFLKISQRWVFHLRFPDFDVEHLLIVAIYIQ